MLEICERMQQIMRARRRSWNTIKKWWRQSCVCRLPYRSYKNRGLWMQLTFIVGCYDENIKILHKIFYGSSLKLIKGIYLLTPYYRNNYKYQSYKLTKICQCNICFTYRSEMYPPIGIPTNCPILFSVPTKDSFHSSEQKILNCKVKIKYIVYNYKWLYIMLLFKGI